MELIGLIKILGFNSAEIMLGVFMAVVYFIKPSYKDLNNQKNDLKDSINSLSKEFRILGDRIEKCIGNLHEKINETREEVAKQKGVLSAKQ